MTSPSPAASSLSELIASMEEATMAAKQVPYDPTRIHQIQASLNRAQAQLSEQSHEPMQLEDPPETEMVDRVDDKMRNCFIRCKRPKRRLSPEYGGAEEEPTVGAGKEPFDPYATRSRSLELVYQFHL